MSVLFLQRHDQSQKCPLKLVENRQKKHYEGINIYYIGYIKIKKIDNLKIFTL